MSTVPLRISSPQQSETPTADLWQVGTEVKPVKTQWLLPRRMTAGSLVIVEGDTDVGKSVFLAHLAAAITSGKPFLGRPKSAPQGVLWLSAEEDAGEHILPRLLAAGGDLSRWHTSQLDEFNQRVRYTLPGCVPQFRDAIGLLKLGLIVVEPLGSHIGQDGDLNNLTFCRTCLDPLNLLALTTGCTIILTRGWRKSRIGPRTHWGEGHNTIGATARVVLQIEAVEGDADARTLRTVKCKGSRNTPLLRYKHEDAKGAVLMTDITEVSRQDETEEGQTLDAGEREAKVEAAELLQAVIGDNLTPVKTIIDAGLQAGLMIGVLRKAKARLKLTWKRDGFGPGSVIQWGPPIGGWKAIEGGGAQKRAPMQSMGKRVKKRPKNTIDT